MVLGELRLAKGNGVWCFQNSRAGIDTDMVLATRRSILISSQLRFPEGLQNRMVFAL